MKFLVKSATRSLLSGPDGVGDPPTRDFECAYNAPSGLSSNELRTAPDGAA